MCIQVKQCDVALMIGVLYQQEEPRVSVVARRALMLNVELRVNDYR
jgi:hypothetical protein